MHHEGAFLALLAAVVLPKNAPCSGCDTMSKYSWHWYHETVISVYLLAFFLQHECLCLCVYAATCINHWLSLGSVSLQELLSVVDSSVMSTRAKKGHAYLREKISRCHCAAIPKPIFGKLLHCVSKQAVIL